MIKSVKFTSGGAPHLRFERSRPNGIDVDFFDVTDGKHLAGRYLNEKDVRDLVEFLTPSEPVNASTTTTERVSVEYRENLEVGDVVVENNPAAAGVVVERQVPAKPAEPEFGYGTAYVFNRRALAKDDQQKRYRGFKSRSGVFYFLSDSGQQLHADRRDYEGFRLEG